MRRSILKATVLAVACAVLLFALPLGVAALRLYQQDEEQELQQLAAQVALSLPSRLTGTDRDPVELPRTESDTRIAVYGPDARRVLGAGPPSGDAPVQEAATGRADTRAAWLQLFRQAAPSRCGRSSGSAPRPPSRSEGPR
ncbi:hypothetical protein [Streptomyces sp. NPDC000133]|uniref:hypothetical protein n=1 Tax=Streptomyces sp. NPDC000133 TaxID=3364535 RepID=UPI0036BF24A8